MVKVGLCKRLVTHLAGLYWCDPEGENVKNDDNLILFQDIISIVRGMTCTHSWSALLTSRQEHARTEAQVQQRIKCWKLHCRHFESLHARTSRRVFEGGSSVAKRDCQIRQDWHFGMYYAFVCRFYRPFCHISLGQTLKDIVAKPDSQIAITGREM